MDSLIHKINLDCLRKDSQAIVNAKIGEASGRKIVFTLYEGRAPFFVPSDTTVIFRAKKPSGAVLYNNCVVDDGKIEYTITSQTVAEKGVFPCEIQIIGADNKVIYTPCITLNVTENLYSDTEVESSNEFTELENALNKIPSLEVINSKYTKPEGGIPKADLAQDVQNSLNKANTALQEHQSLAAYRTAEAQDIIDNGKQDKLIAGKNINIAEDGRTISATSDMDDTIGYFRVTLTERGDGLYTGSKTFAQVKAEIESNKRFMFIDGYDCVLIVTRVGNAIIEFAGMSDGTDGWLWVGVASDDRWEIVPEVRVTLDWYNTLANDIGKLTSLTTTDKTSLVAAVNEVKQTADDKQDKLIAGENITIAADGKTISATGGGGTVPKPLTYDYMPEGYPTKSSQTTVLLEEQEIVFSEVEQDVAGVYAGFLTHPFSLVLGQTYTVNWDGTEYECVASRFQGARADLIGNPSVLGEGEDTGEPFLYGEGMFATLNTSPSHTVSVTTSTGTITPMSAEFIPHMNVSAFTNDAGYLTLATLPKYEGVVV